MTPDQLQEKIQHYSVRLAQSTDAMITLQVQLEGALAKVTELQQELDARDQAQRVSDAEVPSAAEED